MQFIVSDRFFEEAFDRLLLSISTSKWNSGGASYVKKVGVYGAIALVFTLTKMKRRYTCKRLDVIHLS